MIIHKDLFIFKYKNLTDHISIEINNYIYFLSNVDELFFRIF